MVVDAHTLEQITKLTKRVEALERSLLEWGNHERMSAPIIVNKLDNELGSRHELVERGYKPYIIEGEPIVHKMNLQQMVGEWGAKTFPNANIHTILSHLNEEITELKDIAHDSKIVIYDEADFSDQVMEEAADCYILLLQLAYKLDRSLEEAALKKHAVNTKREWNTYTEEGGHTKHVPTS